MSIEYTSQAFGHRQDVLWTPDHYVAVPVLIPKADSLAEDVDGKKILRGGTIYPANDGTAVGVVLQDYDVTNGDANVAIVIHGIIDSNKMKTKPKQAAVQALSMIKFMPLKYTGEE